MIALQDSVISIDEVEQSVLDIRCGASLLFVGRVRGDYKGREVLRLEYEAYEALALKKMQDIVLQTQKECPLARISIVHRVGVVLPNEVSIVIAVATPRRAECYQISRDVLESLKRDVPIWKKEIYKEGAVWKSNY